MELLINTDIPQETDPVLQENDQKFHCSSKGFPNAQCSAYLHTIVSGQQPIVNLGHPGTIGIHISADISVTKPQVPQSPRVIRLTIAQYAPGTPECAFYTIVNSKSTTMSFNPGRSGNAVYGLHG